MNEVPDDQVFSGRGEHEPSAIGEERIRIPSWLMEDTLPPFQVPDVYQDVRPGGQVLDQQVLAVWAEPSVNEPVLHLGA